MSDGSSRDAGLLASLRGLVRTLIAVAHTRLAILASELEEQGACFTRIAVYAAIGAAGLLFTTALGIVLLIAAFWDNRLLVIGILFAVFFGATLWSLVTLRKYLTGRPRLLSATLAELAKDKASLSGINENDC